MKTYYNGPRKGMNYGGGVSMRKPMMMGGSAKAPSYNMGGLAESNRQSSTGQASMMSPMGSMTEKKKFSMGMMAGGKVKKPKMASYKSGGLVGNQSKLDKNKDGKISGKDFKIMK